MNHRSACRLSLPTKDFVYVHFLINEAGVVPIVGSPLVLAGWDGNPLYQVANAGSDGSVRMTSGVLPLPGAVLLLATEHLAIPVYAKYTARTSQVFLARDKDNACTFPRSRAKCC